ncbi:MAG: hypothetical protein R3Y63_15240 [Eubacteriales bacterium]
MLFLGMWLYGRYFQYIYFLFLIPMAVLLLVKPKEETQNNNTERSFLKKIIFCDGNINKLILLDFLSGVLIAVIFIFLDTVFNKGIQILLPIAHYNIVQLLHYTNLKTSNHNFRKIKIMSLVFAFPDIFVFTIGMLPFLPLLLFS